MYNDKRIVVVLPAYNASRTLDRTYREIPREIVDLVILVDDASHDETASIAREVGIDRVITHTSNRGYGGNQKTCYTEALKAQADIVIMVHPDYQYTPRLITAMASIIGEGLYPVVLGSRILGGGALRGGMPIYKYLGNRLLTAFQNLCTGAKLSEYHTGYRAFSADVLRAINLDDNSNNFIFDNEMLSQIIQKGFPIAEITCPTRYADDASSIRLVPSILYGLGVLRVSIQHLAGRLGLYSPPIHR